MVKREIVEQIFKTYAKDPSLDIEGMVGYICTHDVIPETFFEDYLLKIVDDKKHHYFFFGDATTKYGYRPVDSETFVRRLPFFLYTYQYPDEDPLDLLAGGYFRIWRNKRRVFLRSENPDDNRIDYEPFYQVLEDMLYNIGLSLDSIFGYLKTQGLELHAYNYFEKWYDYLKLCQERHVYNYEPVNLLYSYNILLEEAGKDPILYPIMYDENDPETHVIRGDKLILQGYIPVNPDNGEIVKRWVLLWVEGETKMYAENYLTKTKKDGERRLCADIIIVLNPDTRIYGYDIDESYYDIDDEEEEDDGVYWDTIYTPMSDIRIDYGKIRELRKHQKLTQAQVAKSLNCGERTYQNWESGISKPDAIAFIKIMNLFGVFSAYDLVVKERIRDDDLTKFKSGCAPSMFIERK